MQFQCRTYTDRADRRALSIPGQWELSPLVLRKNPVETDNLKNTELSYEK